MPFFKLLGGYIIKKTSKILVIIISMLVSLYLLRESAWDIKRTIKSDSIPVYSMLKMSLYAFIFGVLIEWNKLYYILKGKIKISWLLIPSVLLTVFSFIPRIYWNTWFGLGNFYIEIFIIPETQVLLSAFSGILLVRSLSNPPK